MLRDIVFKSSVNIVGGGCIKIKYGSIYPLPDNTLLFEKARKWRIKLPEAYKQFIT